MLQVIVMIGDAFLGNPPVRNTVLIQITLLKFAIPQHFRPDSAGVKPVGIVLILLIAVNCPVLVLKVLPENVKRNLT